MKHSLSCGWSLKRGVFLLSEKKTTRAVVVCGQKVIIKNVPEHITDDQVRTFALIKLNQVFKKMLAAKGKAS